MTTEHLILFAVLVLYAIILWPMFRPSPDSGKVEGTLRDEMSRSRDEGANQGKMLREEIASNLGKNLDSILNGQKAMAQLQREELNGFGKRLDDLKASVETRLKAIQEDNTKQLDRMRETVDEKLQSTLERRLTESFKTVSERLEAVHQGLGDMQALAVGVGDLKKVMTNVKTRGTWGEIQLGSLLEQILTPEQYDKNVAVRPRSAERVEFAIRLPGQEEGQPVWLPLDSKFPQEDYLRLVEAQEKGDVGGSEEAAKSLELKVKSMARDIRDKYIAPPSTTDFAILFLPTEGLYAELLRRPGLCETLQRDFRVMAAGPSTLGALLNSLQMGFRTLAIQKRSGEVWKLLSAIKTEFGRFGEILVKTQNKLQEASDSIDVAAKRSQIIEKRLGKVHELPAAEAAGLLAAGDEPEV